LGEANLYKLSSHFSAIGSRDQRSTETEDDGPGRFFWAGGFWAAGENGGEFFLAAPTNALRERSLPCAMVLRRTTNILCRASGVHDARQSPFSFMSISIL
jgi:hypothetical protein